MTPNSIIDARLLQVVNYKSITLLDQQQVRTIYVSLCATATNIVSLLIEPNPTIQNTHCPFWRFYLEM